MCHKTKEEIIMRQACVKELVYCLLWRDRAVSIGESSGIASLDQKSLEKALALLLEARWIHSESLDLPPLKQKLRLTGDPSLLSAITQTMLDFEKELIKKRAEEVSLQAAEKLRAIDSLADAIFTARFNVRKDADIH